MDEASRRDLTGSVLGDLRWLATTDLTKADVETLRELSARLRRLLVDGTLQVYRKHVVAERGEPTVIAPPAITGSAADGVVHAQAGGADRGGVTVQGVTVWNRALPPEEVKARYEEGRRALEQPRALKLSAWLSETCVVVGGINASRRDVIKFVANKLGGVHFDPKRKPTENSYGALDHARTSLQLTDLDSVYHELSSIGQQLSSAADIRRLLA